jgi:hypothetical protein
LESGCDRSSSLLVLSRGHGIQKRRWFVTPEPASLAPIGAKLQAIKLRHISCVADAAAVLSRGRTLTKANSLKRANCSSH